MINDIKVEVRNHPCSEQFRDLFEIEKKKELWIDSRKSMALVHEDRNIYAHDIDLLKYSINQNTK